MFRNCSCSCNNYVQNNNNNCDDNMYNDSCDDVTNCYNDINENSCSCGFDEYSVFPQNWMYGHSYVPHQRMNKVYTPEIGLKMGTIFPELVSPYCPNQSLEVINYLKNSNTIGEGCNS